MTTPYSGATPTGTPQGYADPMPPQNYAADHTGTTAPPTTPITTPGTDRPDVGGTSVGALIGEVTKDLSTLMRQELELAKVEMKVEAKKAGQGAGMFGAAAFAGYMTVVFLSVALWWALSHLVGHSWSALIVALLWGAVAAVTGLLGKQKFQQVNAKPERTIDSLSKVPGALKPQ